MDVPSPLSVHVRPDRDWVVVAPEGELDLAGVPALAGAVDELREAGFDAIRLDLRGLRFLDSSGMRFVVELCGAAGDGLQLRVVPGPPAVQRVFEISGLLDLVPFEGVRAAGAGLPGSSGSTR